MTTAFKFNPFTGNFDIVTTQVNLATSDVTGILPEANGGTHQSTYATGDTLYASAANTLSKLPIGSTGNILTVAGGVPSWAPNTSLLVTARAATNAGQTVTSGSTDIIDFEDVTYDTNSNITTGASWKYTVGTGQAGVYNVNLKLTMNNGSGSGAIKCYAYLYKNGSQYSTIATWFDVAVTTPTPNMAGSDSITLADGDYIDIRLNSPDISQTLTSVDSDNHVSIQKVG